MRRPPEPDLPCLAAGLVPTGDLDLVDRDENRLAVGRELQRGRRPFAQIRVPDFSSRIPIPESQEPIRRCGRDLLATRRKRDRRDHQVAGARQGPEAFPGYVKEIEL